MYSLVHFTDVTRTGESRINYYISQLEHRQERLCEISKKKTQLSHPSIPTAQPALRRCRMGWRLVRHVVHCLSNTRRFFNLPQVASHLYRNPKEWFGVPILEQWHDTIINITKKRRYVPKKEIDKP